MENLKPFSEEITTGNTDNTESQFLKINNNFGEQTTLKLGSQEWQKLLANIRQWKKTGGTLHAKLSGKKTTSRIQKPEEDRSKPKDVSADMDVEADYSALRHQYRTTDPEHKVFILFCIQEEAEMQREKGRSLDLGEEEVAADRAQNEIYELKPEEKKAWIDHVKNQPKNWTPYSAFGEFYHRDVGWY